jgi:predicted nucleotidyltransferase
MVKRKTGLEQQIDDAIHYLSKYFNIKQVILFGSQLSGRADSFSDVDLAVISPDFENKNYEEILNVFAGLAIKVSARIDIHPYTERDLLKARPTNFLGSIVKRGKVVYRK